ncbi:hypothetical protein [Hydrogenophaga palleronii]|uniref:hypothetical protein n=1 Tax=Hydrogenophaga palleronii TaxID=65655 RepID=UPI0012EE9D62|nr:hypothetical protein [Hydrogenophaga palleronii]
MIEFETWLPQIVGYCELVVDDMRLRQAWIKRDFSKTSVTDFDELYEQVFDDLDANYFAVNLYRYLPNSGRMTTGIADFIKMLQETDRVRTENPDLLDASLLLDSDQWRLVRNSAFAVLNAVKHEEGEK